MILQLIVVVAAALVVTAAIYLAAPVRTPRSPARTSVHDVSGAPGPAVKDTVADLEVSVLGNVMVLRRGKPVPLSDRLLEALAFLAVHPGGVTEAEIRTAIWFDRPSSPGALRNLLWQLRRQLGPAQDGRPLVGCADAHGKYRLHERTTCDFLQLADACHLAEFQQLITRARGRPFECRRGFEWAHREGLVAWAEARIVAVAEELAEAAISKGDGQRAVALLEGALVVVPEDERLYRVLFGAAAALGDSGGVERTMDRLLGAVAGLDEADPWSVIDRQTLETYICVGGRRGRTVSTPSER